MKQKTHFFSFIITLLSISISDSRCNNKEHITWKDEKQLKWDYFQNDRPHGEDTSATSSIRISLQYEAGDRLKWFVAECLFLKKGSFVGSRKTDYILKHEQGHFDIGEIYTRLLRKEILIIGKGDNMNISKRIDSLTNKIKKLLLQEQLLYDSETKNSLDTIKQKYWDERLRKGLDSLSTFSEHKYWF